MESKPFSNADSGVFCWERSDGSLYSIECFELPPGCPRTIALSWETADEAEEWARMEGEDGKPILLMPRP